MTNIEIRTAERSDVDQMIDWAASEGWNPGIADADAFYSADPDGFLLAETDGQAVACISVVRYSDRFGFLGFYICSPVHRGRGYGLAIWNAGIDYLGGCSVGLDGVVDQQDNYRKSGFVYAHANMRYSGIVDCEEPPSSDLQTIAPSDFSTISAYDRRHFPEQRDRFLQRWLFGAKSRQGMSIVRDGRVRGYGCIRTCREGHKIGPLFADTDEVADILFRALAATRRGEPVILDIPVPNEDAKLLVDRYGMEPVFETARMYLGADPQLPLRSVYGITTFELG